MNAKIEIKSWIDGKILFSGEFGSLRLCVEAAVKQRADLRGAYLQGADLQRAYLRGADLQGADLQRAYLRGADLRGADLQGADLQRAYLRGADLQGADLRGADLAATLGTPDGWSAFTYCTQGEQRVQVGCRNFTIAEGREYWQGKSYRREVLAALDYAEAIGKLRGWAK